MYNTIGKRTLDIFIASFALIVFALPMAVVALWVKLDSRGPVFFKQLRFGKDQTPFTVYKFRTMSVDAPSNVATNSFKNAGSFITGSGKIMRKLSLDELPQLLNVLKGDMSIVGPRPVVLRETRLIELREQVDANSVKPGITGWAQVHGRDELSDALKSRMDGEYVRNFGLKMDVKCILLTAFAVLAIKGQREGHELDDAVDAEPGFVADEA